MKSVSQTCLASPNLTDRLLTGHRLKHNENCRPTASQQSFGNCSSLLTTPSIVKVVFDDLWYACWLSTVIYSILNASVILERNQSCLERNETRGANAHLSSTVAVSGCRPLWSRTNLGQVFCFKKKHHVHGCHSYSTWFYLFMVLLPCLAVMSLLMFLLPCSAVMRGGGGNYDSI